MKAQFHTINLLFATSLLLFLMQPAYAQHGWPIEPTNSDHPMGNSFGEFQDFGGVYQHTGIDILGTPRFDSAGNVDATAPRVRATVGGTITSLSDSASTLYNGTIIQDSSGVQYRYWHLEHGSYDPTFVTNFNNGTAVAANSAIAQLVRWGCDYHHLHYDLINGGNYINPLADITPNPDAEAPQIEKIFFAQDNSSPWVQLESAGPGGCSVVSGQVDIIAQIRDRDNAGSALAGAETLWVRNIRWRACPDANPNCPWRDTFIFNSMPTTWDAGGNAFSSSYFSNRAPWDSDSNYCAATWLYGVVTNFVGGAPNTAGNWDTTAIPDGKYNVSIEATDFAGNTTVATRRACVQNTTGCTTNLTIRDATDDFGAIPYVGGNWWLSPDITANPGASNENLNIVLGSANPIDVKVWNYGSCLTPASTTYNVCLGWALPSGTVPYPLPTSQVIGCQTETIPATGLPVGTSHTTSFTWTPSSVDVPSGHHCLIAWVDSAQDPVVNTPAVNWDDNRAQRNIEFTAPPRPGSPAFGEFWVNPQEKIRNRSIELKLRQSGPNFAIREVRLHVPPGVTVDHIIGGSIIGGYTGNKPADPCGQKNRCKGACMSWQDAMKEGCTLVIGGIDPSGRVLLEGVKVHNPQQIKIEITFEKDIKEGQFAEVDVVEYGVLPGQEKVSPTGGMTINFGPK